MIKVQFFNKEQSVQAWLYENQDIDIISTNLSCSTGEYATIWWYSIMYRTKTRE
jgi:hypothetical protein